MARSVGRLLDTMYENMYEWLYENMQDNGYTRETGFDALHDCGELDLANDWHEWWDDLQD